jgi:pyrimidine operon attenuation protein/uracil phosphoribosyltransferase
MNVGIFNYLFGTKSITEDSIRETIADSSKAKRICFSRIQKHALWRTDDGINMMTVPFGDTIGILLHDNTGITLRKSSKGNYYQKLNDKEMEKVVSFINEYSNIVFLRDLLDASVALSLNFESDGKTYTDIGLLEKEAKYDNNEEAVEQLAGIMDSFINNNAAYRNADCVCAMPPTKTGEQNLPNMIVKKLKQFKGENISGTVAWSSKTESLKNVEGADKLEILKHSGFEITADANIENKNIVLVDDLYMSGTTLQYVAMKLKEAGANKIYGLCLVKSFSNK